MKTAARILVLAITLPSWAWAQYDITWDGGATGTGASWNVPANWNPDTIPTLFDEATFTNTGLSAGKIISLDAAQGVATLTITTATAFTIGSAADKTAGYTLTLTDVNRNDVAGTEGVQTLAADIVLGGSSTWAVDGGNYLAVAGSVSGAYPLVKTGSGELRLSATNSYSGDTLVLSGTLRATATGAIQGNLVVGGGDAPAVFTTSTASDAIANAKNVTVGANGTVSFGVASEHIAGLTITGGTFNTNYSYIDGGITMTGGYLGGTGSFYGTHRTITVNASSSTAVIAANNNVYTSQDSTFTVADGAAVIDLKNAGALNTGSSTRTMIKNGAGVMELSAAGTLASGTFAVNAGTLLVNNTAGSATGQALVTVGGGATLGGTGIIGGVSGYARANVSLAGGSATTLATLAPGTLNEADGSHVAGTLTVGGTAQSNTVTFGAYSQLKLVLGNFGAGDRLAVNGGLNLSGAGDQLTLVSPSGAMLSGTYSLAAFSGALTGRFDAATLNDSAQLPTGYALQYRNSSSQVVSGTDAIAGGDLVLTVASGNWTAVPLGGGGFVTGLVGNADGSTIYCRTDVGGVFRWNAAGGAWISLTDNMVAYGTPGADGLMNVDGIGTDPNHPDWVYIGAGSSGTALRGIFCSTDRGATWIQTNSTIRMFGNGTYRSFGERLAVDPNNPNVVWYGSCLDGLQKGVKSGGSWAWAQVPGASVPIGTSTAGVTFVACDKNGGSTITYAGVYDSTGTSGGGVYVSSDTGTTWSKVGGVALTRPARGQVAANGTLYVTQTGMVAKVARGGSLVDITPTTGINYRAVAVAPADASGNTVYVAEGNPGAQYNKIWRSTDGGGSWVCQYMNLNNMNGGAPRTEPDGTPCLTGYWFGNISSLLVNPANANELWAGDFFGVARTQSAQNLGTSSGAFWYMLQKDQEETVILALKNAPAGAGLLTGVADVGGFRYNDITVRPTGAGGNSFVPKSGNTTGLDFSEGSPDAWARVWYNSGQSTGYASGNGGVSWMPFGEIAHKTVNSGAAGWETWDLGAYLKSQKDKGAAKVTLVVASDSTPTFSTSVLSFDSREAADTNLRPSLLVNGSTALYPEADSYVCGGTAYVATNYGSSATLGVSHAYTTQIVNDRHAYLRFDLSGVATVTSATLQFHRLAATAGIAYPVGVFACSSTSWIEGNGGADNSPAGELTWNNRPTPYANSSTNRNPFAEPKYKTAAGVTLGGGRIAVSATDPKRMVWMPVGVGNAAHYTRDGGITWTASTGGPGSEISGVYTNGGSLDVSGQCLAADRVSGRFYLADFAVSGSGAFHRIYTSTDGAAWTVASTLSNGGSYNMRTPQLAAAPAAGDVWLCDDGTYNGNGGGLWHSTDAAATWTKLATVGKVKAVGFGKGLGGGYSVFIVGYKVGDAVPGVFRSDDGGATWTKLAAPSIAEITAFAADRQHYGRAFIGTAGRGVFTGF